MSTETSEKLAFEAEVNQLLQLMIHSLYSNQEIFLRELISNASDACDKLRFEAIADNSLLSEDSELRLQILFDEQAGTISVIDNGIGMTRDEVVANIGTIANSGTRQYLASLTGDQQQDAKLIGQFGVGFYSAFVVADKVALTTRRAGDQVSNGIRWESDGKGSYTLTQVERQERGTEVVLHIKEDCKEFVNGWRLRSIIKKYSDHITFPIMMEKQVAPSEGDSGDDDSVVAETPEFEQVNAASALWTRPKNEISEEDYKSFYQQISHDYDEPLSWTHSRVEGTQEYTSLLYIPRKAPFDLYEAVDQRSGIKLFVQRVFIMDDAEKLMPRYLRFVRGLVDSSDLPLNVSREILQNNKIIESIRNGSVKKVLTLLESIAEKQADDYKQFWQEFGRCLKEAQGEDFSNREQVARLYRFDSTQHAESGELVSLNDYVSRMKVGQEKIYYITADSYTAARNSPHLEIFTDKGVEVLLLHDRVDEWMMSYMTEFDGKPFASVSKGELDLEAIESVNSDKAAQNSDDDKVSDTLVKRLGDALSERTSEVRVSQRLTSSPACVVLGEHEMALHMQQLMKQAGHDLPETRPILEINPSHPILKLLDAEADETKFENWSSLLLDQALLADGGQLDDGAGFVKRMNEMFLALHQK